MVGRTLSSAVEKGQEKEEVAQRMQPCSDSGRTRPVDIATGLVDLGPVLAELGPKFADLLAV